MEEATFQIWGTEEEVGDEEETEDDGTDVELINVPNSHMIGSIEEVIEENGHIIMDGEAEYLDENYIENLDQIPAENLIYMATEDGSFIEGEVVHLQESKEEVIEEELVHDGLQTEFMECEVTEEVITDDWVQSQGEECVQVTVDQLYVGNSIEADDDINVPLPTDQDEYTTSRPYPCDFCSRRFRKKANLMNHMVAHSNDRPHVCNLCGARYIRRCDLLNHLKIHAYVTDDHEDALVDDDYDLSSSPKKSNKRGMLPLEDEDLVMSPTKPFSTPKRRRYKSNSKSTITSKQQVGKKVPTGKKIAYRKSSDSQEYVNVDDDVRNSTSIDAPSESSPRYPVTDERKPFVCQHCGVSFAREKALASHSRIHGGDSPFECENCGDLFWDISMLQEHIRQRHADQPASNSEYEPEVASENDSGEDEFFERQFYCDSCGMSFHRRELLKRHIKQAHSIKNDGFDDSEIFQGQEDENEEEDHKYNTHQSTSKPLSCNVCGDSFAEALDLLAHAEVHARYEPHKCQLCGESFLEETSIKNHLKEYHSREMTEMSCALCGKPCKNHTALMKHAWEHSRERSHSCSKCGKTFHNKARLKRHMVSHRNKSVKCEVCGDEFPDGRTLMNHRHSHTKSSQFPCHECGKTFGSRSSQQIHIRIHTGERPYGCRYCWKAFADGGTLRKHERIHTGEKPYGCSVCPRAFNQRVVLREHIRSHHSAPDTKRGNSMKPYYCCVCAQLFETSMELIQHLIQHSDLITAMKRQPPTGPRKYKRRRKLKPHELERLQHTKANKDSSDLDYSDEGVDQNDDDEDDILKSSNDLLMEYGSASSSAKRIKTSPKYIANYEVLSSKTKPSTFDESGINLLSNVVLINNNNEKRNAGKTNKVAVDMLKTSTESPKRRAKQITACFQQLATTNSTSRPKMIHTQKTRVPTVDGKRKTKTLITKEIKQDLFSNSAIRARSKNVHYDVLSSEKIAAATFPLLDDGDDGHIEHSHEIDVVTIPTSSHSLRHAVKRASHYDDLLNENLLMEISRKDKYIDKYNSDIVNDLEEILRSPIKSTNNNVPPALIMATPVSIKEEDETNDDDDDYNEVMQNEERRKQSRRQPNRKSIVSKKLQNLQKEISKEEQKSITASLRSQRLSRRQQHQDELREAKEIENAVEQVNEDVAEDLKEQIILEASSSDYHSTTLETSNIIHNNNNNDDEDDKKLVTASSSSGVAANDVFKCEMCSASFDDRSKLLLHVPVHI